ncbi:NUDIX domain-containing protein [Massilia sp. TSP1-1-2]|uniref:NUDIX domain-containing protein n=1 Tax=unclassified Massilia TaxID=2609279 RepID=UPI003CFBA5F3
MDSQLEETRIDGSVVYDGPFLKVTSDRVSLPDDSVGMREYIKHPGAVVILALFDDGRVLLERQFRYPLGRVFIEFPAGKIDPGESTLTCAKRELQEETGYTASNWQFLCTIHNAIAYSDEHLDLFVARGLTAGEAKLDEGEFLETFTATVPEMLAMVRSGAITDVKTIIGAFWLEKIAAGAWQS